VINSLLFIVLSGCAQQVQITCNKPYILVGTECCLDKDDNSICDSDEVAKEKDLNWSDFSLGAAMRGMEDEDTPIYTVDDLKVVFA